MKSFYQRSHWFWVISRIVIVLLYIGAYQVSRKEEFLVKGFWLLCSALMAILAFIDLVRLRKPRWLRISAGMFMCASSLWPVAILLGGLEHGLVNFSHLVLNVVLMLLGIWFVLAGVRDFIER